MERRQIKYQLTPTDIDDPNDESDEEIDDIVNETSAMMDGDNEDLGYADEEDQETTTNEHVDPQEPPVGNGHTEDGDGGDEDAANDGENGEDHHEDQGIIGETGEQTTASGMSSGEVEDVEWPPPPPPSAQDEGVDGGGERGAEGGESSIPSSVSIEIPPVDNSGNTEQGPPPPPPPPRTPSPPPYGSPPAYEEAMRMSARPSMSYIEAVSGDDLEWDRDERVEPTMLQGRQSLEPKKSDGVELQQVVLDSGRGDVERAAESSVADTSFSTPGTGEPRHRFQQPMVDLDTPTSSSQPPISFADNSSRTWAIYVISFLVAIGALLMVILLPLTFSYIEYYQYGMRKGRVSEVVEFDSKIYDIGRYAIGPGKTFKHYPSWAHLVNFDSIDFFTTDRIVLSAEISFQYFIKQDELGLIEQKYDKSYQDIIRSVAEAAIKNKAATYSTDEFRLERGKVEQGLHDALRLKLGGNCCPNRDECIRLASCHLCSDDQDTCNKGFHVDVRYFQLRQLSVPPDLGERYLNVQVIMEGNEGALYRQQYQVITKKTEEMKEEILNSANEITHNATIQAKLIRRQGNATANAKRESAHNQGLKLMYNAINISDDEHKASLHWLRTLERHRRLVTGISFKEYIALVQGLGDDD